jgi:hypothetical protein
MSNHSFTTSDSDCRLFSWVFKITS